MSWTWWGERLEPGLGREFYTEGQISTLLPSPICTPELNFLLLFFPVDSHRKTIQRFPDSKEGVGGQREMQKAGHRTAREGPSWQRSDFPSWAAVRSQEQHTVQSQRGQGASEVILWF